MLYQVIFKDETTFDGGETIFTTKWNEIPNKAIKSIKYYLPDGNFLVLQNYKAYAHVVEATMDFFGPKQMKKGQKVHNSYIMGVNNCNEVVSYRITLRDTVDGRYRLGDITRRQFHKGKEFRGQALGEHVWKKGVK